MYVYILIGFYIFTAHSRSLHFTFFTIVVKEGIFLHTLGLLQTPKCMSSHVIAILKDFFANSLFPLCYGIALYVLVLGQRGNSITADRNT